MRLPLPPIRVRRLVVRRLHDFHDDPDEHDDALEDALARLAAYYRVPVPTVRLVDRFEPPRYLGQTHPDGRIDILHPDAHRRLRVHGTAAVWVRTVLHEFCHALLWADAETKAEEYEAAFLRGV